MKKTRWITIIAAGVMSAGLGMGFLARVSSPGSRVEASVLPDAAAWMPQSATFVAYIDLASLAASPLGEQWESSPHRERALDELQEFRDKTGMDPWTDFRALAISTSRTHEANRWGLALTGDLAPERIVSSMGENAKVETVVHGSTTLFVFHSGKPGAVQALAFPGTSTALFGPPDYVKTMLDVGAGQQASVLEGPLGDWLDELPRDGTFWCAGWAEEGLHSLMAQSHVRVQVPPIESFAVSGYLDQDVSMIARGRASDPESARKLADAIRGFVALGSLQRPSRPEIQAVLDAVRIDILDDTVEVSLSVPYDTLRRIAKAGGPADR